MGGGGMERRLVLSGLVAGVIAGLAAFAYARIVGEPLIVRAIDYEAARSVAEQTLASETGHDHDTEIVSRGVQSGWGLALGLVAYAAALGGIFAVVFAVCLGRWRNLGFRWLAILLAGAGFISVNVVPALKYPAVPPGASLASTTRERGGVHLLLLIASVVLLVLAVWCGRHLASRRTATAGWISGAALWAAGVAALMVLFPSPGELSASQRASEAPLALTDRSGAVVFPAYPTDLLTDFRLYSLGSHLLIWLILGVTFGLLVDRLLRRSSSAPTLDGVLSG
jgi:predicted cobalt transporter CbtA